MRVAALPTGSSLAAGAGKYVAPHARDDLRLLAARERPGAGTVYTLRLEALRFSPISLEAAQELLLRREAWFHDLEQILADQQTS